MTSSFRWDIEQYIIKEHASISDINRSKFGFARGNKVSGCVGDKHVTLVTKVPELNWLYIPKITYSRD